MKPPHMIQIPGSTPSKSQWLREISIKFPALPLLTPSEAKKIQFTLAADCLHLEGPRELLEKLARKLSKLGAKDSKSPYGP